MDLSQSKLSVFLFIYKSDPIIVPFNVFEQFFLEQLGVSSIKELIDDIDRFTDAIKLWWLARDKTMVVREALKEAPLAIALRYRPELFHN